MRRNVYLSPRQWAKLADRKAAARSKRSISGQIGVAIAESEAYRQDLLDNRNGRQLLNDLTLTHQLMCRRVVSFGEAARMVGDTTAALVRMLEREG